MSPLDNNTAMLSATVALTAAGWYGAHLPGLYEMRQRPDEPDLRMAQVQVTGTVLAGGTLASVAIGSPAPMVAVAIVAALFLSQQEIAIRSNAAPVE